MKNLVNRYPIKFPVISFIILLLIVRNCNATPENKSLDINQRSVLPQIHTNETVKSTEPETKILFSSLPEPNTKVNSPQGSAETPVRPQPNNSSNISVNNQDIIPPPKVEEVKKPDIPDKPPVLTDINEKTIEPVSSAEHDRNPKGRKKQLKEPQNKTETNSEPELKGKENIESEDNKPTTKIDGPTTFDLSQNTTVVAEKIDKAGATKRGLIVFGSLALVAVGYIAFKKYRKTQSGRENICFDASDPQFKYGILTSNEAVDNLEMANMPLVDSEDEDELEIFDLEGKKHYTKNDVEFNAKDHLLSKDDVEILDLDLPGYSRLAADKGVPHDDDLLNFDDITNDVLRTSVIDSKKKTGENDNFLDIL